MLVAIIAASAFATGLPTANSAVRCGLASLAVCCFAGGIALFPIFYAAACKPGLMPVLTLVAGGIRLLLTISGIVAICILVKINTLWLIGWTALFYLLVLAAEIRIAVKVMDYYKTV